ncbi:hypothetical protein [uncultured Megasphaera sp.]|uniref:hypothetical protein n=1 Tax=uncultured Megasphaera sp. TaxID=165188 RepID=UPI00266D692D|nr:hypothetical protein [uncultured Megasphaera sp.]
MGRIKDRNYYQVSGWMINRLGLSGRELHAYAIIYGFTQDGETEFNGSINYIAEWLGSSRNTAINVLKSLTDKKLVMKRQINTPDGKRNYYTVVMPDWNEQADGGSAKIGPGVVQKLDGGSAEIAPGGSAEIAPGASAKIAPNNNTLINILKNNIDNLLAEGEKKEEEKHDPVPYQKIKDLYNDTCKSFSRVITISANRKKAIAARWKEYGESIEAFETLFKMAEESNFLKGENERHWTATFDWLMKSANMTKVLEGNYKNKGAAKNASRTKPAEHPRAVTTAELEDKLRKEGSFKGYPDFDKMFKGKGGTDNGSNGEIA